MKIHGDHISSKREIVDTIIETLRDLGKGPLLIPSGRIDALRGGFACIELRTARYIDAVIIRSHKPIVDMVQKYIFDYAIRGTIKGINPGSMISRTSYRFEGLFRKSIVGLHWEVPINKKGNKFEYPFFKTEGKPIKPGEMWEGGPHQILSDNLNSDEDLNNEIIALLDARKSLKPNISVFVDGWSESIRIGIGIWFAEEESLLVYTDSRYLSIMEQIAKHIKIVRQKYGGLTF